MSNTNARKPGTNMKVSNPPNRNGNGNEWENFGNLFLDVDGIHGTLYLKASVEQLKKLIKGAKDGQVEKKIGIFRSKPKGGASSNGGGESAPAAPAAAA